MPILALAVLALAQQPPQRFPDFPRQDMARYDVVLTVDVAAGRLSGHVDYEVRADSALESIRLHAQRSENWRPRFVTESNEPMRTTWDDERSVVEIELSPPLAAGATFGFRAILEGQPVDGFYFKPSRYGDSLAFTDHYSIRARGWLPCEDHPADRAVWNSTITHPDGTECLGYGRRTAVDGATAPSGFRTATFRSEVEIAPYMYSIVVGPFTHIEELGDTRLAGHWVYARDADKARRALVHHAEWIEWMEQQFGPYPFTKYATVQCPTRWGGFESPEVVLVSEALYDTDQGVGTLAHELVHMWFGDAVGYARWHEVWLSEGFASYFGPLLWSLTGGPDLESSMRAMRQRWLGSFEGRTKSIRDDSFPHPDRALNSNTYPKGAWVLHMLRQEVGEASFFRALRAYVERFRGHSVVTRDFIDVVEHSSGRELDWFFEQWLDRVGCPELRVSVDGRRVEVEQVQDGAPYRFGLRFAWTDAEGNRSVRRMLVSGRKSVFHSGSDVESVELDPHAELLFRPARNVGEEPK